MPAQRIAIIGLGRIGSAFLRQILARRERGIHIVAVAETTDTPARAEAAQAGIPVRTLDQIVALGNGVDVIFELTGLPDVRLELREKMAASGNYHSVIASESIVRIIWSLITSEELPEIAGRSTGY